MEPQRESDREGQVDEGVRVALLKLVTDGSRPIGEMSDSWGEEEEIIFKSEHYRRKNIWLLMSVLLILLYSTDTDLYQRGDIK